jgi:hypothetical protein
MKKFILLISLLPIITLANEVKLDNLVSEKNNFCGGYKEKNIKDLMQYFQINEKSDIFINGLKVDGILIDNPEIYLLSSKEQLKEQLLKTGRNKFKEEEIKKYDFSNIKRIIHKTTLRFDKPLLDVEKFFVKNSNYSLDKKGFINIIKTNEIINFDNAKNLEELNNLLLKSQNGSYSGLLKEINIKGKTQTILDYNCTMNVYN